jgi:pyrroline-5-carboxylate reductase
LKKKVGVLGLGQMGAILTKSFSGYLNQNYAEKFQVNFNDYFYLYSPTVKDDFDIAKYKNNMKSESEVFGSAKIILNCVKPDIIQEVFHKGKSGIKNDTLIISIAAGTSIEYMERLCELDNIPIPKIIRTMPNHLVSVETGATVYCVNSKCEAIDEEIAKTFFENLGMVKKVYEKQMNAFTALSGSGPAFVYHFIESLVDAGIKNGIDVKTSREFATQTVLGAAKFLQQASEKNPNTHQYIVTTPKGTTIEGLAQLNRHKFKYAISEAVTAAANRAEEIENEKLKALTNIKK